MNQLIIKIEAALRAGKSVEITLLNRTINLRSDTKVGLLDQTLVISGKTCEVLVPINSIICVDIRG